MAEDESHPVRTIGVLTGGGDCPGLNAVIRAVVKSSHRFTYSVIGFKNGWKGIIEGDVEPLTDFSVTGILPKGGTILGTSNINPFQDQESEQQMLTNLKKFGIDAIVAIGGDGTLRIAYELSQLGYLVVGVPKTIDNDISCTDYTFGFDTAVSVVTEAIDRLHTTAESHHRVIVVEVMGRYTGWIATVAGIAGGADQILIPEVPFSMEEICTGIHNRWARGKKFSILVIAEGAKPTDISTFNLPQRHDQYGYELFGGIGHVIGEEIEKRVGAETRVTVLGHVQRGGTPTAYDRVLATRLGVSAVEEIHSGNSGIMVALQGNKIVPVPLADAVKQKKVDMDLYDIGKIFI